MFPVRDDVIGSVDDIRCLPAYTTLHLVSCCFIVEVSRGRWVILHQTNVGRVQSRRAYHQLHHSITIDACMCFVLFNICKYDTDNEEGTRDIGIVAYSSYRKHPRSHI